MEDEDGVKSHHPMNDVEVQTSERGGVVLKYKGYSVIAPHACIESFAISSIRAAIDAEQLTEYDVGILLMVYIDAGLDALLEEIEETRTEKEKPVYLQAVKGGALD